jgi:RNA polymerase sigma-70 factor, ECF subfamily
VTAFQGTAFRRSGRWGTAAQTKTLAAGVPYQEALTSDTLATLYDAYGERLFRYALMILADVSAAEDAVQEAFVHVASALRRRPTPDVSYPYLAVVVRNECFTALRKDRRRRERPELLIERESPDATEEERMILNGALAALPPEQREVMYLKVFEGLTFQEIADRCGISINTAGSRYRYAAAGLRRSLSPDAGQT